MVSKKNQPTKLTNHDLPEGFENARPELAGAFFRFVEGSTLRGMLLGRFEKPGKSSVGAQFIYQIRATEPCTAYVRNPNEDADDDEKYLVEEVEPGTIVSVDEKAGLKGLKSLATDDSCDWEVFIRVLERKLLAGGHSFWDVAVGKKAHRKDDVPF